MRALRTSISAALATLLAAVAAPATAQAADGARPALGLMGTIPLYWGETDGLDEIVDGTAEPHWARGELAKDYELRPLAYLDAAALAAFDYLLLAQPRALSGEENVALDAWVRAGGRLLLFADPMMTGHSRFAIGDRRRPQDVTLLSPILAHWGLTMVFVEDQPFGMRRVEAAGAAIPVNLPGRFATPGTTGDCALSGERILARCALGQGTATILADAAVLDLHEPDPGAPAALRGLARLAFGESGENAGP
jgi:hypothetical protein